MQIVEIHTFVGIVSFDSKGEIRAQLHRINNDDDRKLLVSYLPVTVSTEAETSFCSGLKRGFEVQYLKPWIIITFLSLPFNLSCF